MDIYKLKSLILILFIYLIAMIPSFLLFFFKKNNKDLKNFFKSLLLCTIIEIIIFSLIYMFPRYILSIFPIQKNIENYSFYALKILFISSITTVIHYAFPIYLLKNKKKKKAFILFSLKTLYIPIFFIINFIFGTNKALYSIPVLDLIYSIFIFINAIKFNSF